MAGKKSKNKGKAFEREIAKFLSNEYCEIFTRTPSSGAYTGGQNAHRRNGLGSREKAFVGDMTIPDDWDLTIECKNYSDIDFNGIISGNSRQLNVWLGEVQRDAKGFHLLFFKISRRGTYLAVPIDIRDNELRDIILERAGMGTVYLFEGVVYWIIPLDAFEFVKEYIRTKATNDET